MNQVLAKVHEDIFAANSDVLDSYRDSTNALKFFEFRPPGGGSVCRIPMILINPPNTMKLKSLTVVETGEQIHINTFVIERDETVSSIFSSILNSVNTVDNVE